MTDVIWANISDKRVSTSIGIDYEKYGVHCLTVTESVTVKVTVTKSNLHYSCDICIRLHQNVRNAVTGTQTELNPDTVRSNPPVPTQHFCLLFVYRRPLSSWMHLVGCSILELTLSQFHNYVFANIRELQWVRNFSVSRKLSIGW